MVQVASLLKIVLCLSPLVHHPSNALLKIHPHAPKRPFQSRQISKVHKNSYKLSFQALCCAWTLDGLHLALGLYSGVITIRDGRAGTEVVSIQRSAPVWALAWCPPGKEETAEQLAVGCWDSTLSFYRLNGQQVGPFRAPTLA
jgi:hypothetical protein